MTVPFLEVVMHTTNEAFKQPRVGHFSTERQINVVRVKSAKEEEEVSRSRVNYTSVRLAAWLILPISSLIFTLVFWIVGLIQYYSSVAIQDPNMTDCLNIDHN